MDCLDGLQYVPSNSVQLVVADPPYFLGLTHNGKKGCFGDLEIARPFFRRLASEIDRILDEDGEFYIFTDWRGYAFYYPIFAEALPLRNLIVWDKKSGAGNFYTFTHEFIMFGCKNSRTNKRGTNVWREPGFCSGAKTTNGEKVHPTQKPVELIEKMFTGKTAGGVLFSTPSWAPARPQWRRSGRAGTTSGSNSARPTAKSRVSV